MFMKPTGEVITTHGFRRQPRLTAWLTFAPLLIWIAMFVVVPSGIMVIYSFLTRGRYRGVVWEFTFDNYTRIFLMDSALSWYSRVVLFSLIGLIVGAGLFVVALRLAEWLVERFTHQDMAWFQNRLKPVAIFGGSSGWPSASTRCSAAMTFFIRWAGNPRSARSKATSRYDWAGVRSNTPPSPRCSAW